MTGKDVLNFSIATNDRGYPTYVDCTAWAENAVNISKYFGKGGRILLNGHLKNEEYDTKAGKVKKLEVVVDYWEFCDASSGKKNDEAATPNPFTNPPQTEKKSDSAPEEQPVFDELTEEHKFITPDDLPF